MRDRHEKSWGLKFILCAGILACCLPASLAAGPITGVVHNQTQHKPAAGDEVVLLGVGQGAHEETRVKTDPQGSFALDVPNPDKPHLIRVVHQGVNYDYRVAAGKTISIDIFDAAAKVQGISGGIEIIRAGTTDGNLLHVSDMVEIKNDSNPRMTQANERTFEVYLPAHAKIDSVMAAGPDNLAATISAKPAGGESGHYTVNFPLRPGATKFAFNYDIPYDGRATFRTKHMYPLQQLAVMIPPTMTFTSRSPAFQILPVGNSRYDVEAAEQVKAGEGPEFEISGVGALPSPQAQVHAPPKPLAGTLTTPALSSPNGSAAQAQAQGVNTSGVAPVLKRSAPSSRSLWLALGAGAVLMLGTCGFLVWRRQRPAAGAKTTAMQMTAPAGQSSVSLVEGLKEGLFQLEIDRLQGAIPKEEYVSAKQALEGTIEWALARGSHRTDQTPT